MTTHSIRQFPLHLPSRASPCANTFQLEYTIHHSATVCEYAAGMYLIQCSLKIRARDFCEHRSSSLVFGFLYASQAQAAGRLHSCSHYSPFPHTQNKAKLLVVLANHKTVIVRGRQRKFDNPSIPRSNPQRPSTHSRG